MSRIEVVEDPEKDSVDSLDTLTPLPVLPVSSKAVIQDAADGLAVQSGVKEGDTEQALVKARRTPSSSKRKRKVSLWIRYQLWFTTYRYVESKRPSSCN